ncbi:MAG: hypothetical protein IT435_03920 [Phycisphaerales bacterium]|nr:hypothetical protein [Phycisphaerales bacterium]
MRSRDAWTIRIVGGLVVGLALMGLKYCIGTERRADASKEMLKEAQEMIKEAPGYNENGNYMNLLVKEGHEAVFNDT